jgi:hypothetical protein
VTGKGHPLPTRLRWRAERLVARLFGRRVRCAACGQPLFKALPVVWRGRLVLIGLRVQEPLVRVRFGERDSLEFLHGELGLCRTDQRPWARTPDIWPS